MTQWLCSHHLFGLVLGLATFLVIGIFHPIVIKGEYYFGTRCWWVFLLGGIAGIIGAIVVADTFWSSILGVVAFSSLWAIGEIFEQRKRVARGWFPKNPRRRDY